MGVTIRTESDDELPDPAAAAAAAHASTTAESRARLIKAKRRRYRLGYVGLGVVTAMLLFAVIGPWLIPYDPNATNLVARNLPAFSRVDGNLHLLGTDPLGRDLLARLAVGGRASLTVVLASLVIGGGLGIAMGLTAGYFGGWWDNAIMRLVDAQLAVPTTIFAMVIASALGVGFTNTAIALGFSSWPIYARILRAEVLNVRRREYVLVATTLGVTTRRLLRVHILPNVIGALAVVGTLELGRMILVEATLSFIGLGMQPPDASWGSMIRSGQEYIFTNAWLPTLPGVFIVITVLGMNLMGDWLRDVLDPRSR